MLTAFSSVFGQKMWFTHFHVEENLTTALNRYGTETKRICGVIDTALRRRRTELKLNEDEPVWLVGEHYTYADLAFVPWNTAIWTALFPEGGIDWESEVPEFCKWHKNLVNLPAVKEVLAFQAECIRTLRDTAKDVRNRQADARKD